MKCKLDKWRKVLTIAFILSLVITLSSTGEVFASEPSAKDETFAGTEFQTKMDQAIEEGNFFERIILTTINYVFKMTGLAPITELVYGQPYQYWIADDAGELKYGLFFEKEIELIIEPVMAVFVGLYTTFIVIAILLSTLKMGVVRPHSPQAVSDFWKDIQMWVISAIFMFGIWDVVNILSGFNMGIVKIFNDLLTDQGISTSGISIVASASETTWSPVFILNLGDVIIYLGEWILGAILNFIYLARKITILILLLLSPVVAYALLYARTRPFFSVWLKEMCGNIFLQSMHALLMYGIAVISSMGATALVKLFLLCLFIPLSGLVSKWLQLGDSSSKIGQGLTMTGLSSVGGLIALAGRGKQAFGGNKSASGTSGSSSGGSSAGNGNVAGPSANDYSVGGLTHRRENGLNKAVGMMRTVGTIAGATVGSLAGMVAGPGGAVVGGMIGSKLGGVPVDMADNFGRGVSNTISAVKDYSAFKKTDPNKENLVGQRFHKGQIGAAMGQMVGGNRGAALGKKIGIGASGITRRSAAVNQFKGRSADDLVKSNPNAKFYYKVDSQKSAFYMRNPNGEDELVSVMGSGMAGLENPVYVDYQAPPAGSVLTPMGNGRYSASYSAANVANNTPNSAMQTGATSSAGSAGSPSKSVPVGASPSVTPSSISAVSMPSGSPSITPASSPSVTPVAAGASTPASSPSVTHVAAGASTRVSSPSVTHLTGASSAPEIAATSSGSASVSATAATSASVQSHMAKANANGSQNYIDSNAGLSGSSQHLLRKSDAYTMDAQGNRYDFRDLDASKVDVDAYFNQGADGMKNGTFGGRVLDKMRNTPTAAEAKSRSEYNQKLAQVAAEAEAQRARRKGSP